MNEAETRAEHIDPALLAAGWGVVEGSRIRREYPITLGRLEGFGRRGKPLTADCVLIYRNTKLGVVEAKASTASICRKGQRAKCPATRHQMNCGISRLPKRMLGATVLPSSPSKTEAAISKAAIIRTSPSSGCWKPWPPGGTASC